MNFLVIDVETGGLDPEKHSLLEVALLAYCNGEIIGRKQLYIKEEEYHVTPKAMEINGLRLDEVAKQGVVPYVAIQDINQFMSLHFANHRDAVVMGHNVGFDVGFLKKLYSRYNYVLDNYMSHRKFDTSTLIHTAKAVGVLPMEAPGALHKLADYLQIPYASSHEGLADAELTVAIYEHLIQLLGGNIK